MKKMHLTGSYDNLISVSFIQQKITSLPATQSSSTTLIHVAPLYEVSKRRKYDAMLSVEGITTEGQIPFLFFLPKTMSILRNEDGAQHLLTSENKCDMDTTLSEKVEDLLESS